MTSCQSVWHTPIVLRNVAVVVVNGFLPFEFGTICEVFGVDRVKMVYGWSMGAQQAYHWAALFGEAVERIVVNCGSAKTAPHNFVFLEGVRTAVQNARTPQDGLRAMGRIYAGWALSQDFYRANLHLTALKAPDLETFLRTDWEER